MDYKTLHKVRLMHSTKHQFWSVKNSYIKLYKQQLHKTAKHAGMADMLLTPEITRNSWHAWLHLAHS